MNRGTWQLQPMGSQGWTRLSEHTVASLQILGLQEGPECGLIKLEFIEVRSTRVR